MTQNQTQSKVSIETVTVVAETDSTPDLSHLGKYQDSPGPDDRTVDRKGRGDMADGEVRYFVAAHSREETGNADSVGQDYRRAEAFNRHEWTMYGIRVAAVLSVAGARQTMKTPGLWGVESDSGDGHFRQIAREELAEMRGILAALGIEAPEPFEAEWAATAPVSGTISIE